MEQQTMDLPDVLASEVRSGRVVLFLGAGASFGAKLPNGNSPPLGLSLRNELSSKFLGGEYSEESLAWVSELAISATDLSTVQDYIAELFQDLKPAEFHKIIPSFKWRGIVTTNYDRLIETTYGLAAYFPRILIRTFHDFTPFRNLISQALVFSGGHAKSSQLRVAPLKGDNI